jgi:hypothetical protein
MDPAKEVRHLQPGQRFWFVPATGWKASALNVTWPGSSDNATAVFTLLVQHILQKESTGRRRLRGG